MLSVVVPLKDEEDNLEPLARRLLDVLEKLTARSEVTLVDNGSRDETYPRVLALHASDPRFKVVRLSGTSATRWRSLRVSISLEATSSSHSTGISSIRPR